MMLAQETLKGRPAVGCDDFAKIRDEQRLYIDKTAFVRQVVECGAQVQAYLRPRRFGKSLALSMLRYFFDCQSRRPELFEGLEIAQDVEFCRQHQGQYPVISLSLKEMCLPAFAGSYAALIWEISELARQKSYLADSPCMDDADRELLWKYRHSKASEFEICSSLRWFSERLSAHHGQPCIILLDEYDVPLNSAYLHGYYEDAVSIIRSLLGQALKGNTALKLGVVTGCLRIARESIFTGLNNLEVHSVLTDEEREWFGFSPEEVRATLAAHHVSDCYPQVCAWYDGYLFGHHEVYNPWSILSYLASIHVSSPRGKLKTYWVNTSENAILQDLLQQCIEDGVLRQELEQLLAGESVAHPVEETLTYAELSPEEMFTGIWSLLLFTGYLTLASPRADWRQQDDDGDFALSLRLPNREVKKLLVREISRWQQRRLKEKPGHDLLLALSEGHADEAQAFLNDVLLETISYYDFAENFYHAFLVGILASTRQDVVRSNRETGHGRADIVVVLQKTRQALVLEVKVAREFAELETRAREGLAQIEERQYDAELATFGPLEVRRYGVAFWHKRCFVAGEE